MTTQRSPEEEAIYQRVREEVATELHRFTVAIFNGEMIPSLEGAETEVLGDWYWIKTDKDGDWLAPYTLLEKIL